MAETHEYFMDGAYIVRNIYTLQTTVYNTVFIGFSSKCVTHQHIWSRESEMEMCTLCIDILVANT